MVLERIRLEILLQGHGFGGHGTHHPRSHSLIGLDVVELDYVLDDLVLVAVYDSFLLPHIGHCGNLLTADGGLVLRGAYPAADVADEFHQRVHYHQQHRDSPGGETHQAAVLPGSYGLGDNLGADQYEHGGKGGHPSYPHAAEGLGGKHADQRSAEGIGDGIHRQDGRYGPVYIGLISFEENGRTIALFLPHDDVGQRSRHQHGFQNGTKEGDSYRQCQVQQKQKHVDHYTCLIRVLAQRLRHSLGLHPYLIWNCLRKLHLSGMPTRDATSSILQSGSSIMMRWASSSRSILRKEVKRSLITVEKKYERVSSDTSKLVATSAKDWSVRQYRFSSTQSFSLRIILASTLR